MKPSIDYTLCVITNQALMSAATLEESVSQAIQGGCTVVQLREKDLQGKDFYECAAKVRAVTATYGVPLIINDRVDIALAVKADGVHLGQNDLPVELARSLAGSDFIIGVSVSTLEEARAAQAAGADYLGVGAMFATGTKNDATIVSFDELTRIREAITLPLIVIGGINKTTIPLFLNTGIDGIAVVSAIVAKTDGAAAARELKALFIQGKQTAQ